MKVNLDMEINGEGRMHITDLEIDGEDMTVTTDEGTSITFKGITLTSINEDYGQLHSIDIAQFKALYKPSEEPE